MQHLLDNYRLAVYLPYRVPQSVSLPHEYTQLPINFDYLEVDCSLEEGLLENSRRELTDRLDPLVGGTPVRENTPTSDPGLAASSSAAAENSSEAETSKNSAPAKPSFDLSEFEDKLPNLNEDITSNKLENSVKEDLAQLGQVFNHHAPQRQKTHPPVNIYQTLPPTFKTASPPLSSSPQQYGPFPPNAHIMKSNSSSPIPQTIPRRTTTPPPLPPKAFSNSPPAVNPEYIEQLTNMGFNRSDVVKALEKFNNDLAQATNHLLDHS